MAGYTDCLTKQALPAEVVRRPEECRQGSPALVRPLFLMGSKKRAAWEAVIPLPAPPQPISALLNQVSMIGKERPLGADKATLRTHTLGQS